jgi:hypothetical protein
MPSYNEISRIYRGMPLLWEIKYISDNLEKIEQVRVYTRKLVNMEYFFFRRDIYPDRTTHLPVVVSGLLWHIGAPQFLWRNPNSDGTEWNTPDMTNADLRYLTETDGGKRLPYFNENIGSASLFLGTGWAKARELTLTNRPVDWNDLADSVASARFALIWGGNNRSWLVRYVGSYADELAKHCRDNGIPENRLQASRENPVYRGKPEAVKP